MYKRQEGIDDSLKKLGLDYMDLYLLHQPYGDTYGAWRALEEAQKVGKIKSIGVSNFYPDQLKNLELMSNVKPSINQIEVSPGIKEMQRLSITRMKRFKLKLGLHLRKVSMTFSLTLF